MVERPIHRLSDNGITPEMDDLAEEEIITLRSGKEIIVRLLATPSDLSDLALGHIRCEDRGKVDDLKICGNEVILEGHFHARPSEDLLTAACGACTAGEIQIPEKIVENTVQINLRVRDLLQLMNENQPLFKKTGGVHAAALFAANGDLLFVREDVGRHNAFDKVVGAAIKSGDEIKIIVLSGRTGWELIAKAARIGIEIVISVGAISSAAESLARSCGITLVGFASSDKPYVVGPIERIVDKSEG
ncbi:MAG: formate dehydrogenase accessory sulfurtransferase FdhD [Candidatus Poseidoniaceae archaeon]|jgi:FdhD protein|nr:formate dehydrogenase accessory sulfurtransferase FdhD [Candidatus Poseidoniaceae archaeon]